MTGLQAKHIMCIDYFLLFPSLLGIHLSALSTLLTRNQSIIQLTAILKPLHLSSRKKKKPTKNKTLEERGTRKETTNAC